MRLKKIQTGSNGYLLHFDNSLTLDEVFINIKECDWLTFKQKVLLVDYPISYEQEDL